MAKYFSASTVAFYDTDIIDQNNLPEDSVLLTDEEYADLMSHQCSGCVIVAGTDGRPVAMQQACEPCSCLAHDETIATTEQLGHIKIGSGLTIEEDGTVSAQGNITAGDGLSMDENGVMSSNLLTINNMTPDAAGNITIQSVPTGAILPFASSQAPAGYLLCNGAAVSRETYVALFSEIGTTYGAGDGSTTFNLPALNGYIISEVDNGDLQVKGTGMVIGLTNGTNTYGTYAGNTGSYYGISGRTNVYGQMVGQSSAEGGLFSGLLGITTDGSKSGMVATMNATKTQVKYYIKY